MSKITLSVISGFFLILSFPNFLLQSCKFPTLLSGIIAWISLVPLLIAIYNEKPSKSFISGLITGYIFFSGSLYWIAGIKEFGILAPYALLLLSFYLALYIGVFCFLVSYVKKEYKLWFIPFIFVSLEYIRALFLSGFPWSSIGYSQFQNLSIIQISSLTGVYGVSFIVVLVNSFIAYFIINYRSINMRLILSGLSVLFIISISILFGYFSIKNLNSMMEENNKLDVVILQGNIPQDEKWEEENVEKTFEIYDRLSTIAPSGTAAPKKNSLIIFPETAIPVYLLYDRKHLDFVSNIAKRQNSYLLTGIPDLVLDKSGNIDKYLNTAILIHPDGSILDRYDKIHLVPFGEFTPLRNLISFFEKFTAGFAEYSPGKKETVFEVDNKKFSVVICYEIIFPHLVRRFLNKGAEFLVNITNDAWYGRTAMPYQHVSMAIFRSIENRVYIFRSANTGVSCIINPSGKITKYLDIFIRGGIKDSIKIFHKKTFYTRYGDIFVYFCIAFSGLIVYKSKIWIKK